MRLTDARLSTLESLAGEFQRRVRERIDLPEVEEWRAFGDLRAACEQALGDAADVAAKWAILDVVYVPVTSYAVRLSNIRMIRVLAGEIFSFLGEIAATTGATDAWDLMNKNVVSCRADRLPRQVPLDGVPLCDLKRTERLRRWAGLGAIGTGVAMLLAIAVPTRLHVPLLTAPCLIVDALCMLLLVVTTNVLSRLVEAAWTQEGLVIQNKEGRFYVGATNLRSVVAGPGGFLRIRLRRVPKWLPATCLTVASTRSEALAIADRLRGQSEGTADWA